VSVAAAQCILDGLAPGLGASAVPDGPSADTVLGWVVADVAAAAGRSLAPAPMASTREAAEHLRQACGLHLDEDELAARTALMQAEMALARRPVQPPAAPVDVPSLLITAGRGENGEPPTTAQFGPDLGWSSFVAGPRIETLATATHTSLLAEPQVQALAVRLREAFEG
jgi:thioesterase domain-containing protein